MAANPSDTRRLSIDREVTAIRQCFSSSPLRDKIDLDQNWAARLEHLSQRLLEYRPHIVHFSGHGSPGGELLFENITGSAAEHAPQAAIAELFGILKDDIRLVVLNACFTEAQARAIAQHVDCVVGTSTAIGDRAATAFAGGFYRGIAHCRDVMTAFRLGCTTIDLESNPADVHGRMIVVTTPGRVEQSGPTRQPIPRLIPREGVDPAGVLLWPLRVAVPPVVRENEPNQDDKPLVEQPTTRSQQLLSRFVDREAEFKYFCRMLDTSTKPIFVVWADGGLGKTWLVKRLAEESEARGHCAVLVDEDHHVNYFSVLRAIQDKVGPHHFHPFADLVNYYTVPADSLNSQPAPARSVNGPSDARIEGSSSGALAAVTVEDRYLTAPRSGMDVPEAERMVRLTRQFVEDFEVALADRPVVVFFDAAQKMPAMTQDWLWRTVFGRFVAEGRLKNVRFVLTTREKPSYHRDLSDLVEERHLMPLDQQHVEIYLAKRGIAEEHRKVLAQWVRAAAEGHPDLIALHTDRFVMSTGGQP
jgi:CHAT domain